METGSHVHRFFFIMFIPFNVFLSMIVNDRACPRSICLFHLCQIQNGIDLGQTLIINDVTLDDHTN